MVQALRMDVDHLGFERVERLRQKIKRDILAGRLQAAVVVGGRLGDARRIHPSIWPDLEEAAAAQAGVRRQPKAFLGPSF